MFGLDWKEMTLTFSSFDHSWIRSKREDLTKSLVQYCKLRWLESPTQLDPFFTGVMIAMAQALFQHSMKGFRNNEDNFQVNTKPIMNKKLTIFSGPYTLPIRGHRFSDSLLCWNHKVLLAEIQHALSIFSLSTWHQRSAYTNRLLGWYWKRGEGHIAPSRIRGTSSTYHTKHILRCEKRTRCSLWQRTYSKTPKAAKIKRMMKHAQSGGACKNDYPKRKSYVEQNTIDFYIDHFIFSACRYEVIWFWRVVSRVKSV